MTPLDNTQKVVAFLFAEGGEITRAKLARLIGCDEGNLRDALKNVAERLRGIGIGLVETATAVSLAVSPEVSGVLQEALKRELDRDIGDAGLEVLAIVLYAGSSTRARIDYIRGVNSSSTLRILLTRGLLERVPNPDDAREYLYRPTVELLAHLGVTDVATLPDYGTILAELSSFETKSPETHDGRINSAANS